MRTTNQSPPSRNSLPSPPKKQGSTMPMPCFFWAQEAHETCQRIDGLCVVPFPWCVLSLLCWLKRVFMYIIELKSLSPFHANPFTTPYKFGHAFCIRRLLAFPLPMTRGRRTAELQLSTPAESECFQTETMPTSRSLWSLTRWNQDAKQNLFGKSW